MAPHCPLRPAERLYRASAPWLCTALLAAAVCPACDDRCSLCPSSDAAGCPEAATRRDAGTPDAREDAGVDALAVAASIPLTVYHLPGVVDPTNIVLEPTGLYYWIICGCDYLERSAGYWAANDGELVLLSLSDPRVVNSTNAIAIHWFQQRLLSGATVRLADDGESIVVSGTDEQDRPYEDTLRPGRMCARCGGLGPAETYPCAGKPTYATLCNDEGS